MKRFLLLASPTTLLFAVISLLSMYIPGFTNLASVATDGTQGNQDVLTAEIALSGTGQFVAFESKASNLVPNDFNDAPDLFVHDRSTGFTEMIPQGNNTYDQTMAISFDGRFVAFRSNSSNLVPDDTNGVADVFLYDRQTDTIKRVSISSEGEQANDRSFVTAVSKDGRFVSFYTYADNLLPGYNSNRHTLIHDAHTGLTISGSVNSNGQPVSGTGKITSDARFLIFHSYEAVIPEDTNGYADVYEYDRWLDSLNRVSVNSAGDQANEDSFYLDISTDGRFVVFGSYATNLVPMFVSGSELYWHDLVTGETQLASIALNGQGGIGHVFRGAISDNGRFVTFNTIADNIIPNDTNGSPDVFIRDMFYGQTRLVSANLNGEVGNGSSAVPEISDDGRVVAFGSHATDLVSEDTNGVRDIFTRVMWFPTLTSNYADGAPGSFFAITGTRSLVTSTITMTVNGVPLGVVPVEPDGTFAFQLDSAQADPGRYTIAVFAPFADEVAVIELDPDAPLRPPEGNGPVFVIPAGIAERFLYLPAVYQAP